MRLAPFLWLLAISANGVQCTMVSLPSITFVENPADSCAATTYTAEFPRCKPSTAAIRRLNRLIEERCREAGDYNDALKAAPKHPAKASADCDEVPREVSGECELPYRVGSALSFKCRRYWGGLRSGSSPFAINVDIAHGQLAKLELDDLLEAGSTDRLWALVREDLDKQDVLDDEGVMEKETGPLSQSQPAVNLTPSALVLDFGFHFSGGLYVTVEIPYSALNGILRPRFIPSGTPPN